jgi:hypothetical protein
LAAVLQWALVRGLTRYHASARGVWNAVVHGRINADIIVCGSSRALVHYDPAVIAARTGRSAFNLGRNGTWPDLQLIFLKTYLAHNRPPKCIVLNVDHTCFAVTKKVYDPGQYIPYLNEPAIFHKLVSLDNRYERMRRFPLLGVIEHRLSLTALAGLVGIYGKEDHFNGFAPSARGWTGEFDKFKHDNPNGFTIPIEEQGPAAFSELVETALSSHSKVVLVYSPEYFEAQVLTKNRNEILEQVRKIAAHYGVEFWDFSNDPICYDKSLFYNSQHMNKRGADLFSRELGEKLSCFCASGVMNASRITAAKHESNDSQP